jgi:hypothetical protein
MASNRRQPAAYAQNGNCNDRCSIYALQPAAAHALHSLIEQGIGFDEIAVRTNERFQTNVIGRSINRHHNAHLTAVNGNATSGAGALHDPYTGQSMREIIKAKARRAALKPNPNPSDYGLMKTAAEYENQESGFDGLHSDLLAPPGAEEQRMDEALHDAHIEHVVNMVTRAFTEPEATADTVSAAAALAADAIVRPRKHDREHWQIVSRAGDLLETGGWSPTGEAATETLPDNLREVAQGPSGYAQDGYGRSIDPELLEENMPSSKVLPPVFD